VSAKPASDGTITKPTVDLCILSRPEDNIEEIIVKAKPYVDHIFTNSDPVENFANAKNQLQSKSQADYVLWWDSDEDYSVEFLKQMKEIIQQHPALCYRFPRINLPTRQNYPDYQVRLFKRSHCHWERGIHEIVMSYGTPADQIDCVTLEQYRIIHKALSLHTFLSRFRWHAHLYVKAQFPIEHLIREIDEMVDQAKKRFKDEQPT